MMRARACSVLQAVLAAKLQVADPHQPSLSALSTFLFPKSSSSPSAASFSICRMYHRSPQSRSAVVLGKNHPNDQDEPGNKIILEELWKMRRDLGGQLGKLANDHGVVIEGVLATAYFTDDALALAESTGVRGNAASLHSEGIILQTVHDILGAYDPAMQQTPQVLKSLVHELEAEDAPYHARRFLSRSQKGKKKRSELSCVAGF
eukprot:jgi/Chlat1/4007/Chrsp26S08842